MSNIYLYNVACDRKLLNKTGYLTEVVPGGITESFNIRQPSSIIRPVITLSRDTVGSKGWAGVNYAYIPSFKRYYFVNDITARHDGLMELSMEVDVLQTYYSQLLNIQFEIARSESVNSPFYIDTEKALMNRRVVKYAKIGEIRQSTGNKYVITVAGG